MLKLASGDLLLRPPNTMKRNRSGNRLLAYVTMAGTGIAACATAADAEVVYTPTHANIHFNYPLDLNHDGIPDFTVFSSSLSGISYLGVVPDVTGNKIAVAASHKSCLAREGTCTDGCREALRSNKEHDVYT